MSLAVSDESRSGGLVGGVCTVFVCQSSRTGRLDYAEFFEETPFPHRD